MITEFIHDDCVQAMGKMVAGSVDVVVTSPPYNLGIKYNEYLDEMKSDDYLSWIGEVRRRVWMILKKDGSFFLNFGSSNKNPILPFKVALEVAAGFTLQNTFHWIKSITVDGTSRGHYKPVNSPRYVNDCHEYVFHFTKTGDKAIDRKAIGVPYADKSNIARRGHTEDLRCRGNNWFIPYKTIQSRDKDRPHPATFPPELAEMCIRLHGDAENLTVVDPFVGIGNSAVAAKRCRVKRFVGIDVDEGYLDIATQTVEKET